MDPGTFVLYKPVVGALVVSTVATHPAARHFLMLTSDGSVYAAGDGSQVRRFGVGLTGHPAADHAFAVLRVVAGCDVAPRGLAECRVQGFFP